MADGGIEVAISQTSPVPVEAAFTVGAGEFMALVGPSGAGKTTLLRMIAGHHRPTRGRIVCNGAVWTDTTAGIHVSARRRRVGLVFQSYALFPHLTALENVSEALLDRPAGVRRDEARELLRLVHLAGLDDRRPGQLSGGQQQRVAVARALARRPDILLLDEPFSAVDRKTRDQLHGELAELRSRLSMPTILVTHDLDDAARFADTAAFLSAGRMIAKGPVQEVFARLDLEDVIDRQSLGAIISARIVGHDPEAGISLLSHPAGRLIHPLLGEPVGATIRLRIHARDVALAVGDPGRLSIRNRLAATIVAITPGPPPIVEVSLDAGGEPLIATITRDAAAELGLAVGMPVTALIKSVAFDRPAQNGNTP